jgi:hypothetical protein
VFVIAAPNAARKHEDGGSGGHGRNIVRGRRARTDAETRHDGIVHVGGKGWTLPSEKDRKAQGTTIARVIGIEKIFGNFHVAVPAAMSASSSFPAVP